MQKSIKQTFVINVLNTQHHSWQGDVTWVQTNKKEYFRSALELIRLIDSAVDNSMKDKQ